MSFDEVFEVKLEPRVGSEDESGSGLEESLQGEMVFTCIRLVFLSVNGRCL